MPRYGVLVTPAMNQVYADASARLMRAEVEIMSATVLGHRLQNIENTTIGGTPYVIFEVDGLDRRDIEFLSNLSSLYALFEFDRNLLRPIELRRQDVLDDDIMTIQKYSGKTNQYFTKLLLNLSILSAAAGPAMIGGGLSILDPLCGRGTTLNQALTYGFDAAGVEIDRKDFEAYATFIQTYVKNKRLKHHAEYGPVRRNRQVVARRLSMSIGLSRESYKAGESIDLTVINADTREAASYFRRGSFDTVVTDLPYGVQHGSRADELSRRPTALLESALPVWRDLLKPGGTVGLAFNSRVGRRDAVAEVVAASGLEPITEQPYLELRHRVDQAISRDVLIARKPASPADSPAQPK